MKYLIMVLFLAIGLSVSAQTVSWGYYNNGLSMKYSITYADSTKTSYTSDYYDWTLLDGATLYYTYSFVQANFDHGAGNDTALVILLGQDGEGNTLKMDTITVVSNITQAAASTQTVASLTSYAPRVAFRIQSKHTGTAKIGNGGVFKLTIYAPVLDIIPPRNGINW